MFTFPQTHEFPDLVTWFQTRYDPLKRTIVAENGDILISITLETINQMLLPQSDSLNHFSQVSLMEL